jgi:hypothetical protein
LAQRLELRSVTIARSGAVRPGTSALWSGEAEWMRIYKGLYGHIIMLLYSCMG